MSVRETKIWQIHLALFEAKYLYLNFRIEQVLLTDIQDEPSSSSFPKPSNDTK